MGRADQRRARLLLVTAAVLSLLVSCTSEQAGDPTSTPLSPGGSMNSSVVDSLLSTHSSNALPTTGGGSTRPTTSNSTIESASASRSTPTPSATTRPGTSVSTTPRPTTSSVGPTTGTSSLDVQQQADAAAALEVFARYVKVLNAANENPGAKDWTKDISTVAADPVFTRLLASISNLKRGNAREVQHGSYRAIEVGTVEPAKIQVYACLDLSEIHLAFKGKIIKGSATPTHTKATVGLYKYADKDGGWLVSEYSQRESKSEC